MDTQINEAPKTERVPFLDKNRIQTEQRGYERLCRVRDVLLSVAVIAVLFVPSLFLMLAIVLESPGASPIYRQARAGKDGREFQLLKFRSMIPNAEDILPELEDSNEMDGPVFKMKDDPRITRIGRVIRRIGVDELPQFINILRGDMRVVGPRPALFAEIEKYDDYEKQRLYVVPGLTCLWQIQPKRNDLSFEEWLELDLQYIQERSFLLDLKIILQTAGTILRADGV